MQCLHLYGIRTYRRFYFRKLYSINYMRPGDNDQLNEHWVVEYIRELYGVALLNQTYEISQPCLTYFFRIERTHLALVQHRGRVH